MGKEKLIEPCSKAAADESDEAEESSREHELASSPFIESRADKDTAEEKNEHLENVSWRLVRAVGCAPASCLSK